MDRRLEFDAVLKAICEHTYFQPPSNAAMVFPCITYERSTINTNHANDKPYLHDRRYTVTVIDKDPDSALVTAVAELPKSRHASFFVANQLNHDVFDIFF